MPENRTGGAKSCRFVIHSVEAVKARLDLQTKTTMTHLRQVFANPTRAADKISASMLFRRSIEVYGQYVGGLEGNAEALQTERSRLTLNTRLPKVKVGSPTLTPDR